jgi:hypothetical protein
MQEKKGVRQIIEGKKPNFFAFFLGSQLAWRRIYLTNKDMRS